MDSQHVFDLGTIDLSEGQSTIAALAGHHDPLPLETAIWPEECSGPLGFPPGLSSISAAPSAGATSGRSGTVTESSSPGRS